MSFTRASSASSKQPLFSNLFCGCLSREAKINLPKIDQTNQINHSDSVSTHLATQPDNSVSSRRSSQDPKEKLESSPSVALDVKPDQSTRGTQESQADEIKEVSEDNSRAPSTLNEIQEIKTAEEIKETEVESPVQDDNIIDSPKNDNKEVSTDLPPLAVLETSQIVVSETTEEKNENPVEKNEIPVEKNEIPVEKNENPVEKKENPVENLLQLTAKKSIAIVKDKNDPEAHEVDVKKHWQVQFGMGLYVYGNVEELGMNDPSKALKLEWSEGDYWVRTIKVKSVSEEQWNNGFEVQLNYCENSYNDPNVLANKKSLTESSGIF